ncbi:MAG: hypothetical protein HYZ15_08840 [Sphingobacteriales bacterium]|nr:hypothetical protein [Sphingobacteriales bacterium]
MFFFSSTFYIITLVLQGICVFHCIRKGNQQNWIWLIVFLPLVGCIIYFFSEILTSRGIRSVQTGVSGIINPSGSVRKLEENLRFSDTFNNRIALADAYLASGRTRDAIDLYEKSLTGAFAENEDAIAKLAFAHYREKNYEAVIREAKKICSLPQFPRSKTHILYAMSLGYAGQTAQAEEEFLKLKGRFSNFEARYYYSLFLQQNNRSGEARAVLNDMIAEVPQLSGVERRHHREWISLAKDSLNKMP